MESMHATPIWEVNTALAKDDVRSRSRLVVTNKAEACPLLLLKKFKKIS